MQMGKVIQMPTDSLAVAQTLIWNIAQGHINSMKMFYILKRTMENMGVTRLLHGDYVAVLVDGVVKVGIREGA